MMTDTVKWSAWEKREYCGCGRVGYVCGFSFLLPWEMMGRCEVGGILLALSEVAVSLEINVRLMSIYFDGFRLCGSFLSNIFSFL